MPDHVGLVATEEDQRTSDDLSVLADGDRAAGHRATAVHSVDLYLEREVRIPASGEDGVDGFDGLPLLAGQPGHHRLRQQLAAEDDAVLGRKVGSAVAVVADGLERQSL